jgi:excisionase family DNA binding protein
MSYHCNMAVEADLSELTVQQAAEIVHRDRETIRRWVRSGRLPHRRVGTTILLHRDDLMDLVVTLESPEMLPLPEGWRLTHSGAPMPNLVAAVQRLRAGR